MSVCTNHEKLIINRISSYNPESKNDSLQSREIFTVNVEQINLSEEIKNQCDIRSNNAFDPRQLNDIENDLEENKNSSEETNRYTKVSGSHKCTRKNIVMASIFIILATTGVILVTVFFDEIKGYADEYSDFMKTDPELAVFFFMIAFTSSTPFCIPATFFILLGSFIFGRTFGFLYGFIIFTLVDYICQMVGVFLAFLNGRYLFRKCIQNCIQRKPKLLAISEALTHNAKKLVFLLRLSNLTPYDMLNYLCSITNMSALDYIIGNTSIILCDAPFIYVCVSITDLSNLDNASQT